MIENKKKREKHRNEKKKSGNSVESLESDWKAAGFSEMSNLAKSRVVGVSSLRNRVDVEFAGLHGDPTGNGDHGHCVIRNRVSESGVGRA